MISIHFIITMNLMGVYRYRTILLLYFIKRLLENNLLNNSMNKMKFINLFQPCYN